jgi:hypothetical protein
VNEHLLYVRVPKSLRLFLPTVLIDEARFIAPLRSIDHIVSRLVSKCIPTRLLRAVDYGESSFAGILEEPSTSQELPGSKKAPPLPHVWIWVSL